MNQKGLINSIIKSGKQITNRSFNLILRNNSSNFFHYVIEGTSDAINKQKPVKVFHWFDNFWLFLEVIFEKIMKKVGKRHEFQMNTRISLSVFQGKDSNIGKYQLFRAEWDDYNNPEEKHAQPHWHITSSQAIEKTLKEHAYVLNEPEFLYEFEREKQKVIDIKQIHFAMNGDWQNNRDHIHKIDNEQQVVRWLKGMLNHIRTELERFNN